MFFQSILTEDSPCVQISDLSAFPSHWHSEIEIIYCLEGSFTVVIDNQACPVRTGQTVFVGSAEPHEYTDCAPGTKILLTEIGEGFFKKSFQSLAYRTFDKPVIDTSHQIKHIFDTILDELKQPATTGGEWVISSCLFNLAAFMVRELPSKNDMSYQRKERILAMQRVNAALEYLRANYQNQITVDAASNLTGYGKSNFCKQFKRATQMTFHQYLNMFRISKACILLQNTDEPISEIAEATGFPETKTFCRVFKQLMNMTPTEYRKITCK